MLPSHQAPSHRYPKAAAACCSLQTIMVPLLWFYLLLIPLCLLYLIHVATTVSNNTWVLPSDGSFSHTTVHTTVRIQTASFASSSFSATKEQRLTASASSAYDEAKDGAIDINNTLTTTDSSTATVSPSSGASMVPSEQQSPSQPDTVQSTATATTNEKQRPNLLLFSPDDCPSYYPPSLQNTTYRPRKPMWIAGYPGSGNDLLRNLVEHLSGFPGKDVYTDDHCHLDPHHEKYDAAPKRRSSAATGPSWQPQRAATCKTHFPVYKRYPPHQFTNQMAQDAAILLLRNPMNAMPSHFNFLWEYKHEIPDHSQQAPEEDWIAWRDANWQEQLRLWQQVLYYWYEHWELLIVLPYEHLIQPTRGPALLQLLAAQLHENHVPTPNTTATTTWLDFDTYEFGCHWHYCVQSKRGATVKRSGHAYQPTFTPEQYQALRLVISETYYYFRVRDEKEMSHLLLEYLTTVHSTAMQVKHAVHSTNTTTTTR
jgi:hypothetical protein